MGPTASGKTDLAIILCQLYPFELINVDASQVYRGMDIGTGKPSGTCRRVVPHRLIDIREPHQTYSAADFYRDACRAMGEITEAGKIPLLVGGTMFYFRTLERGIDALPAADPTVRDRLTRRADQIGWPALHRRLAVIDPCRARRIDPNDGQRIQRALELSALNASGIDAAPVACGPCPYRIHKLAVTVTERSTLHQRIEKRFRKMLAAGLVDEVQRLLKSRENTPDLPAFRMIGYRQTVEYLDNKVGYNELFERAVASTRQLAKRQLTWLRNQGGVVWVGGGERRHLRGHVKAVSNYLDGALAGCVAGRDAY